MSDGLLDGDRIRAHLAEVAAALPVGRPPHRLILVGGSLLAWHGLRDSTRDVDSVTALDATLRKAVETVAARHGLPPRWLNDHPGPSRRRRFASRTAISWPTCQPCAPSVHRSTRSSS